jgi:hypothetical protein
MPDNCLKCIRHVLKTKIKYTSCSLLTLCKPHSFKIIDLIVKQLKNTVEYKNSITFFLLYVFYEHKSTFHQTECCIQRRKEIHLPD